MIVWTFVHAKVGQRQAFLFDLMIWPYKNPCGYPTGVFYWQAFKRLVRILVGFF